MAPKKTPLLSERLLKLQAENPVEPYEVTDSIVVQPLTKKRGEAMREAQMSMLLQQTLLNSAMNRSAQHPPNPGPQASPEELAAHDAAVKEWEAEVEGNDKLLKELSDSIKDAETAYNQAFFGDAHDAVMEFFDRDDVPQKLWDAFVPDIRKEFLPSAPQDGTCPACGQVVDEEEAGKAPSSSI